MAAVVFHYKQIIRLKNIRRIKTVILKIFYDRKVAIKRLDYVFCSDAYLLDLNRKFLAHDYYTDILTFANDETGGIKGEIYISVKRVIENAKNYEVAMELEMLRVIFHGVLHICGYGDDSQKKSKVMRYMEDKYIKEFLAVKVVPRGTSKNSTL